jgi:hypothetical protein
MIRPFTVLCFLLACGSGLYLYQSKHRVQMLDREIERTVHATEALRDQSRLLGAEWMLLNDPERLRALADQFLTLKTVTPTQFTTLADLDHRLPPVRSPDAPLEPVPEPAVMTPMIPPPVASKDTAAPAPAVAATAPAVQAPAPAPKAATPPAAPRPAPAPLIAERKPAPEKPRIVTTQAEPRPTTETRPTAEPRQPAEPHGAQLASATPRPAPAPRFTAPISQAVAPMQGGSALGMASHGALPMPMPMPIAPQSANLMRVTDH